MAFFQGHWEKTWRVDSSKFQEANFGLAFSGHSDVGKAISESSKVYNTLAGNKCITIGGGNSNGRWTKEVLSDINRAIDGGAFQNYYGISFDVEEGDIGLKDMFKHTFSRAKSAGFFVIVAFSHTAPYGITDARDLMMSFIYDNNIDVLSPIMYSTGTEYSSSSQQSPVDTSETYGKNVPWELFQYSKAEVVPSLWNKNLYDSAAQFLQQKGVTPNGYIAWCS